MKKIFTFIFILCSYYSFTQDSGLSNKKEYAGSNGKMLPYRILYPEQYDKSKKYPLVLFLHGAGERGNDNEKQLTHGSTLFTADSNRKKFPCIVVFPQCPTDSSWTSVTIDRSKTPLLFHFDYTAPETWPLKTAIELVKKIATEEGVDKSRLYITGLSMGGMGTFEAEYRYPGIFAAAMPICGGGDTTHYDKRIERTSFWIFHGDSDAVVNVEESRAMVRKLQSLHVDVKYTEYPGVNHNSWDNAFAEPTFLSWMFAHKRNNVKL
ncbi:MAG TPA: prolyl oligopeptidase family serine peptidase [Chitinophagaceae bacterium]|jgi:predicted peptidase